MTPQKLWVLKAHTKFHKIGGNCQIVRQPLDIYRNIDNQKTKKLKKKQKKKQTYCQTDRRNARWNYIDARWNYIDGSIERWIGRIISIHR